MRVDQIQIGRRVYVKGTKQPRVIVRRLEDVDGGVELDKPVDGFRLWNIRDLRTKPA